MTNNNSPSDIQQPELDEVDIEEYAARGEKPPRARFYNIKIDGQRYRVDRPSMTGRELLELARKSPPENYRIFERYRGKPPVEIALDEKVDFTRAGVENFVTLPRTSPDGEQSPTRQFRLPSRDEAFLDGEGYLWETHAAGEQRWLLIRGFSLPSGFTANKADMAILMPQGYPEAPLDMALFNPPLARSDGKAIPGTGQVQLAGQPWQQWSRHRPQGEAPWRPGVDDVALHLTFVRQWLQAEPGRG